MSYLVEVGKFCSCFTMKLNWYVKR
jgi:hypothetical protein